MDVFDIGVKDTKELQSKYIRLRVSFKDWVEMGFSYTILCTDFDSEKDTVKMSCDSIKDKPCKLSQLLELINMGELIVVGGKLK